MYKNSIRISYKSIKIERHKHPFTQVPTSHMKRKMPSLYFSSTDDGVMISGKTFIIKDRLKEIAHWVPKVSLWKLPPWNDFPERREELEALATQKLAEEKAANKAARLYAKSPEGKAAAAAAEKELILKIVAEKKAGKYHWICCENCEVIDWDRHHASCSSCGHDGNTFFVNGMLRTGD